MMPRQTKKKVEYIKLRLICKILQDPNKYRSASTMYRFAARPPLSSGLRHCAVAAFRVCQPASNHSVLIPVWLLADAAKLQPEVMPSRKQKAPEAETLMTILR
jgi:hypothetical protein